jgi:hypothetical protein
MIIIVHPPILHLASHHHVRGLIRLVAEIIIQRPNLLNLFLLLVIAVFVLICLLNSHFFLLLAFLLKFPFSEG